jgi:TonB family protein
MASCRNRIFAAILLIPFAAHAYQAANPSPPSPQTDPILAAAENLIGQALFLRGFYASNNLVYDATGKLEATPKSTDWTLAAVNILKATHPSPTEIQLEGLRVAIRYNPDAHEFQRHPLNDQKIKILIKLTPSTDTNPRTIQATLATTFAAIFSIGIDPALQRSMPLLWRHYFDPGFTWPPDALTGETIYQIFGQPGQPKDVSLPIVSHKAEAEFTDAARNDKVKGPVQLVAFIDAQGVPQRIFVTRPLGYGLDERAAEALAKWRFKPALRLNMPVTAAIVLNLDFEIVPPPPH